MPPGDSNDARLVDDHGMQQHVSRRLPDLVVLERERVRYALRNEMGADVADAILIWQNYPYEEDAPH